MPGPVEPYFKMIITQTFWLPDKISWKRIIVHWREARLQTMNRKVVWLDFYLEFLFPSAIWIDYKTLHNFIFTKELSMYYSRVRNKHTPTFINFWDFFQGLQSYYGLKRLKFYYISLHILRGYIYSFCQIFQRLHKFKGLRLFRTRSRVLGLSV